MARCNLAFWQELLDGNLVACGVTYPVLLALVSSARRAGVDLCLILDPGQIEQPVNALGSVASDQNRQILSDELDHPPRATLGVGAVAFSSTSRTSAAYGSSAVRECSLPDSTSPPSWCS